MDVTQLEWERMAEEKLASTESLLADQRWTSAFYLAGYVIECSLKARIVARVSREPHVIFEDEGFSKKCWTHKLLELVRLSGLWEAHDLEKSTNATFASFWKVVEKWNESSRYETKSEIQARDLYDAIADPLNGVLKWIRSC